MTAIDTSRDGQTPEPESGPGTTDDRRIAALFGELSEEAKLLARLETDLAKAELGEAVGHAKKAGAGFGAAGVLGYMAVLLGSFAAAYGLAEIMPTGLAFLIVALLWAAGAAAAYFMGRRNLNAFDPVPHRTVQTIKEDVAWLRHRTS